MKYRKIEINIPIYEGKRLRTEWEINPVIITVKSDEDFLIKANKDGLVSLAKHLLTLAQDEVSNHRHIHYDPDGDLESGSFSLIIEKDNNLE